MGAMFVTPGATNWKLGDIKLVGADPDADVIQFLEWDNAGTYLTAQYLDETFGADSGWYDVETSEKISDLEFDAGTAFLCAFTSGNEVEIACAGEVSAAPITITVSQESPFLANPCPRTITLAEVKLVGADPDADVIQFLEWDNAGTYQTAQYLDETFGADSGWYDVETSELINTKTLEPGDAFLGAFTSGNEITVKFPAAIVANAD